MLENLFPSNPLGSSCLLSKRFKQEATPHEAACYIAQICAELQEMALDKDLDMLVYLLANVRQEALEFLLNLHPVSKSLKAKNQEI